ncbi:hypothetical protein COLO4_22775 [Corchorus olitorius]|uniref:Uncharacterized protein n=1 Tax=Corchorus olitorius TaxID=93759 RepID=A0A1R3IJY5_9ROSI|nr:hypothetical protein COLO4_22775 [Corchorus olitorius]
MGRPSGKMIVVLKNKNRLIWQRGELARNHSNPEFPGTNRYFFSPHVSIMLGKGSWFKMVDELIALAANFPHGTLMLMFPLATLSKFEELMGSDWSGTNWE